MECGRQRLEIQTLLLQRNLRSGVLHPFSFGKKTSDRKLALGMCRMYVASIRLDFH